MRTAHAAHAAHAAIVVAAAVSMALLLPVRTHHAMRVVTQGFIQLPVAGQVRGARRMGSKGAASAKREQYQGQQGR